MDYYSEAKRFPEFSGEQINTFIEAFKSFDLDGNGSIDAKELGIVLRNLGENVSATELQSQIDQVDTDKSGAVEFGEFLQVNNNNYFIYSFFF